MPRTLPEAQVLEPAGKCRQSPQPPQTTGTGQLPPWLIGEAGRPGQKKPSARVQEGFALDTSSLPYMLRHTHTHTNFFNYVSHVAHF